MRNSTWRVRPQFQANLLQRYGRIEGGAVVLELRDTMNFAHARRAVSRRRGQHRSQVGEIEAVGIDLRAQWFRAAERKSARRQFKIRELQVRARDLKLAGPGTVRLERHLVCRLLLEKKNLHDPISAQIGANLKSDLCEGARICSHDANSVKGHVSRRAL